MRDLLPLVFLLLSSGGLGATGGAFLGMTLGCARCDDHKFDPITQEDYDGHDAAFSGIRHG